MSRDDMAPVELPKPRHRLLTILGVLLGLATFLLAVLWINQWTRERIANLDRYTLAFADIDCPTPPDQSRAEFLAQVRQVAQSLIAWQEDWFCYGVEPLAALRKAFASGGFFHVEMFQASPGAYDDLLRERHMENTYARALQQPENFIFTRDAGAAWDIVTIGVFRDLKHYAASADATPEAQQAAAKAAGFESPAAIGPYLRRFIRTHHDTLAVTVK